MSNERNEFRSVVGGVPALTHKERDLTKCPIDSILKQAIAGNEHQFLGALSILQEMHRSGRSEAGIFLLGLLVHTGDDWVRRSEIVEHLEGFNTPECAYFLFSELERVKSNNTTRRYLAAVLKVLAAMPRELVQRRLLELTADNRFSSWMRDRFIEALDKLSRR